MYFRFGFFSAQSLNFTQRPPKEYQNGLFLLFQLMVNNFIPRLLKLLFFLSLQASQEFTMCMC